MSSSLESTALSSPLQREINARRKETSSSKRRESSSLKLLPDDASIRVEALYHKVYNSSFQILSGSKTGDFLTKKFVGKKKENLSKFLEHVHVEVMRRLKNLGNELDNKVISIPQEMFEEVLKTFEGLKKEELQELYQQDLTEELDLIPVKDLLERVNTNLKVSSKRDLYIKLAKGQIDRRYKACFSDKTCLYPIEDNLAQMRRDILELYPLENTELKGVVLECYIDLCEADPISRTTSEGLVDCIETLLTWHDQGLFNKMIDTTLLLTIKSFALTLECLLLHMSEHLSAQSETIKKNSMKLSSAIKRIDIHQDERVLFWSEYAEQASYLIQTDESNHKKIFEAAIRVIRLGVKLGTVIATPTPDAIQDVIEESLNDIGYLYDQIKWGSDWFVDALALKKASRVAIYNTTLFNQLIPTFRNSGSEKKKTIDVSKLDSSKKNIFFSHLKNLETSVLKSPDERVRWESLKLIIHFFYIDNPIIKKRVIELLLLVLGKGTSKIKNTAHILLEFINVDVEGSLKEVITPILDKKNESLAEVTNKSKFYPQVVKYFFMRSWQIRQFEDNAGISLLSLLAYTTEPIDKYLEVFAKVPALTKDHHDYKANSIYHIAAQIPNLQTFRSLLKSPLTIPWDTPNQSGERPSHIAVRMGQFELLQLLIDKGIDLRAVNALQETLIHLAVGAESTEILHFLCEKQLIDINALNSGCKTALNLAIERDFIEGIEILESYGAQIAETRFNATPIMVACKENNWKVVIHYLNKNNATLLEMASILHMICKDRRNLTANTTFVKFFFRSVFTSNDFREKGQKFLSIPHPRLYIGESERDLKSIFNLKDFKPSTPDMPRLLQLIIQKEFRHAEFDDEYDPNLTDDAGISLLMLLSLEESSDAMSLAKKLLKKGADPHAKHPSGITPFLLAAALNNEPFINLIGGKPPSIKLMIEDDEETIPQVIQLIKQSKFDQVQGKNMKGADSLGCTPLMYLAGDRTIEGLGLASRLLDEGEDPLQKNILETNAVISAFAHGNIKYIKLLESRKVSFDTKCVQGFRPVHLAAMKRQEDLLELLIAQNADFNCTNQYLSTPLHLFCGVDPNLMPTTLFLSPVNPLDLKVEFQKNSQSSVSGNDDEDPDKQQKIKQELKILDELLKRSNPLAKDAYGNTCLTNATIFGEAHVIEHLLEKYPELFWIPNDQGVLPIQFLLNRKIRTRDQRKINAFNLVKLEFNDEVTSPTGQTFGHIAASAMLKNQLANIVSRDPLAFDKRNPATGQSPLHEAAKVGFIDILGLINPNKSIEQTDLQGHTPFQIAAIFNNVKFMREYHKIYPKSHLKANLDGRLAIHLAASKGHVEAVDFLLEKESPLNQPDNNGDIPIHLASRYGHFDVLLKLYQKDHHLALISNDDGLNSFLISCVKGHVKIVCFFLNAGVEVMTDPSQLIENIIQSDDWSKNIPKKKIIDPERAIDPDMPNDSGLTGLYLAASKGHQPVVRALICAGASPYVTGDLGETAAHVAAYKGYFGVLKDIIDASKRGLETSIKGPIAGIRDAQEETPLHEVVKSNSKESDEVERRKRILSKLLKHGAPPNHPDEKGQTPLHILMRNGSIELADEFLTNTKALYKEHNRNPDYLVYIEPIDHLKNTPLHYAAGGGHDHCVRFLTSTKTFRLSKEHHNQRLRRSISLDPKNHQGETPLWMAAKNGLIDTVKLLHQEGATLKVHNKNGQNLFHLLFSQKLTDAHKEIFEYLIKQHPREIYHQDEDGNTPLHVAAKRGDQEDGEYLLQWLPGSEDEKLSFLNKRNKDGLVASEVSRGSIHSLINGFNRLDLGKSYKAMNATNMSTLSRIFTSFNLQPQSTTRASSSSSSAT